MTTEAEQRPTCETCPYWDQWEENAFMGHCRRNAPVAVTLPLTQPDRDDYDINSDPTLPNMCSDEWCGEHPDMNEWIARNRREKALHDKHVAWAKEFQHGQRVMHCDGSKGRVIGQHGDDNEEVNVHFDNGVSLSVKPRDIVKIDEDNS